MSPRQNLTGASDRIGLFLFVFCALFFTHGTSAWAQAEGSVVTHTHRVQLALISALERQDIQEQLSQSGLNEQDVLAKLNQLSVSELDTTPMQTDHGVTLLLSIVGLTFLTVLTALLTDRLELTRIFTQKRYRSKWHEKTKQWLSNL